MKSLRGRWSQAFSGPITRASALLMASALVTGVGLPGSLREAAGQTPFTGTYTFTGSTGTNSPFAYNGTDIANLTESGLSRTNLPVSNSAANFRSNGFPLDLVVGSLTGSYDATKYFEFSLTPTSGYALTMSNITFGLGRSATGPRSWAWASSVDNFASFTGDYSSLGASGLFSTSVSATNPPGAIYFVTDTTATTGTNLVLNVSGTSFQNLSTVTFRLYGWNSEGTAGTGGLQGPLSFSGSLLNLNPVVGGSYWAADPAGGGSGTWTSSGTTWATGVGGAGAGQTQSDQTLMFADTAGTVAVSGSVTVSNGMTFQTNGYTVAGGTISLAGAAAANNAIATDAGVMTLISSEIAGTTGMTTSGSGTLVLSGSNTFFGNLAISAGTLQIAGDSALGNAANDLANNGTLRTTGNVTLGAGRDITGSGTFDIAPGTTLTSSGSFAMTATTLANGGTFDLQGSTRSVGVLTFGTAATVNGSGAIALTSVNAAAVTSGSAILNAAITFPTNKNVEVGAGGTLVLNGDVAGSTGRLTKIGGGTLIASGSNSTSGFRLGIADAATRADGGTLILTAAAASGTGQLQFNYGTLEATAPLTFANGLAIGGRSGALAVLGGTNAMVFSGASNFYRGSATSGYLRFDVNNSTSLNGPIGPTNGSGTASEGIMIGGSGSLAINGNALALVDMITLTDAVDLLVGGTLGGPVTVGPGSVIGGNGLINGSLHLDSGAAFIFDPTKTLTVNGAVVTFGGFGVVDLVGFSPAVPNGRYTLIDGIATTSTTNLLNIGPANAYVLGGGRSAYFEIGSLTLLVVPEPSGLVLATGALLAVAVARRKRATRVRPVPPR